MQGKVADIIENGVTTEAGSIAASECSPPIEDS
jgi:hypothetical protein